MPSSSHLSAPQRIIPQLTAAAARLRLGPSRLLPCQSGCSAVVTRHYCYDSLTLDSCPRSLLLGITCKQHMLNDPSPLVRLSHAPPSPPPPQAIRRRIRISCVLAARSNGSTAKDHHRPSPQSTRSLTNRRHQQARCFHAACRLLPPPAFFPPPPSEIQVPVRRRHWQVRLKGNMTERARTARAVAISSSSKHEI